MRRRHGRTQIHGGEGREQAPLLHSNLLRRALKTTPWAKDGPYPPGQTESKEGMQHPQGAAAPQGGVAQRVLDVSPGRGRRTSLRDPTHALQVPDSKAGTTGMFRAGKQERVPGPAGAVISRKRSGAGLGTTAGELRMES